MDDHSALHELERRRCEAIGGRDVDALMRILDEDYFHVHATGRIDDRLGFIEGIQLRPRMPMRGTLRIRVLGHAAILLGEQVNQKVDGFTTAVMQQVAVRGSRGEWRYVSAQVTRLGAAA